MKKEHNKTSKTDYLPLLALLLGASIGGCLGASLDSWRLLLAMSDAFEMPIQKTSFAVGASNSLISAYWFGTALVVAVVLEFIRAKIAVKLDKKSRSQSTPDSGH